MKLNHKEALEKCGIALDELPTPIQNAIANLEFQIEKFESEEPDDKVELRKLEHKSAQIANEILDWHEEEMESDPPQPAAPAEPIAATPPVETPEEADPVPPPPPVEPPAPPTPPVESPIPLVVPPTPPVEPTPAPQPAAVESVPPTTETTTPAATKTQSKGILSWIFGNG